MAKCFIVKVIAGLGHILEFTHAYIQNPDQEEELFHRFFETGSHEARDRFWQSLEERH